MPVGAYRELKVWQCSMSLVTEVHRLTAAMPKQEAYWIGGQMRRAAVSIPSNIAEGHARRSKREYLQFVSIALGSLAGLETQLTVIEQLGLVTSERAAVVLEMINRIGRMLRGLEATLAMKVARFGPIAGRH